MKKFVLLMLVAGSAFLVTAGVSQAGRRGGCCCYAPAAPAVAVPAPATAAAPQSYRSYSYQPQSTYSDFERNWGGHAYQSAVNKSLGRVN